MAQDGASLVPTRQPSAILAGRVGQSAPALVAWHLGEAPFVHGTISRQNAAAIHLEWPQSNSVAHISEALVANATAVLTRSGTANQPVLSGIR